MANSADVNIKQLEARCRLVAADLESKGFDAEHDGMVLVANSLVSDGVRLAQQVPGMPLLDDFVNPQSYQTSELADVGTEENPRPTEDEILGRKPAPGSRLDPTRGPEDVLRKWVVEIRDIPAKNEDELRSIVEPFVDEIGGLLADYKEEAPRTRQKSGG